MEIEYNDCYSNGYINKKDLFRNNVALAVRLALNGNEICVSCTHMFWDPNYPEVKLSQTYHMINKCSKFSNGSPLVLCGDFNR